MELLLAAQSTFQNSLIQYLMVSVMLFVTGLLTIMLKRNTIAMLMGVELLLNAANLNFVAFARFRPVIAGGAVQADLNGHLFAIFVIILAAAEAAVGLAIAVNYVNRFKTIDIDNADQLKG